MYLVDVSPSVSYNGTEIMLYAEQAMSVMAHWNEYTIIDSNSMNVVCSTLIL